ncbi:MAG: tetrahydromethanopterin S-methyltransferase subunit A [Terriglobia bacterium]|jgi:tetrahydromethanopterin S-methyltransferase subunit A
MLKVSPPPNYPPEEGRYLRGNDYSPVAVAVILIYDQEKIPPDIENLVRVGLESGAALSGTIQTESIGIEKLICNIVANPNIRYLVLFGPESPGHQTGDALLMLLENGVDERRRIIGAKALTPYLFNLPEEYIARFRQQVRMINLLDEGDPDLLRRAVRSCYQEDPTLFQNYRLFDPGAYPEGPLSAQLTWRVTRPQAEPKDEGERQQRERLRDLMARVKRGAEKKRERARP